MDNKKETLSGRGGKRLGSGRPVKPDNLKAKNVTIKLYDWEREKVKEFIKSLRNSTTNC